MEPSDLTLDTVRVNIDRIVGVSDSAIFCDIDGQYYPIQKRHVAGGETVRKSDYPAVLTITTAAAMDEGIPNDRIISRQV